MNSGLLAVSPTAGRLLGQVGMKYTRAGYDEDRGRWGVLMVVSAGRVEESLVPASWDDSFDMPAECACGGGCGCDGADPDRGADDDFPPGSVDVWASVAGVSESVPDGRGFFRLQPDPNGKGGTGAGGDQPGGGGVTDPDDEAALRAYEKALAALVAKPASSGALHDWKRAYDDVFGDPYDRLDKLDVPAGTYGCVDGNAAQLANRCPPPYLVPLPLPSQAVANEYNQLSVAIGFDATVSSDQTACESDLLQMAGFLIGSNGVYLSYALCLAGASDRVVQCMMDQLLGGGSPFDVAPTVVLRGKVLPGSVDAWTNLWTHHININQASTWWQCMVEKYCSGDEAARACAAVDVAALIVHEMMHMCWADLDEVTDECSIVYLVENTYRWALMNVYSATFDDPDCCATRDRPLGDGYEAVGCYADSAQTSNGSGPCGGRP